MPFFPYYALDPTWLLLIPAILLGMWAQYAVKNAYQKYSQVPSSTGYSAAEAARGMLDANNLRQVGIQGIRGQLSDHYDLRSETLGLSEGVYRSNSVAALAIAAHEVGHAIQHNEGYVPLTIRNAIVPIANIGSGLAWPMIIAGMIFSFPALISIGILAFSTAVVFQLITLPTEFNASKRAGEILVAGGYLREEEMPGARKVLRAAAMTYVAAALASILQLLRLLLLFNGNRRRD